MTKAILGRPRQKIDDALLQSAGIIFIDKGYQKATLDDIAAAANSTKPTIYLRYPNKESLFEATMTYLIKRFSNNVIAIDYGKQPYQALLEHVQSMNQIQTSKGAIGVWRLIISESIRFPSLTRRIRDEAFSVHLNELKQYLDTLNQQQVLLIPDCDEAAFQLSLLTSGGFRHFLGVEVVHADSVNRLENLVAFFIKGYAPPPT